MQYLARESSAVFKELLLTSELPHKEPLSLHCPVWISNMRWEGQS